MPYPVKNARCFHTYKTSYPLIKHQLAIQKQDVQPYKQYKGVLTPEVFPLHCSW